ncbi:hypothetical protein BDW22DRAFT_1429405 [Trametopsis cervina]|nr:hypothetical protein BDW22DRAFT_1429405 [Trametopsis cervina]
MSTPPACIRLPREIVDLITSNLKDDKKTLSACCLISRSTNTWIASCRAHLFKDFTVHIHRRGHNLVKLLKLLETAWFVAESVELLCLRNLDEYSVQQSIDVCVAYSLLDKLPHLRELALKYMYCAPRKVPDVPHTNAKFKLRTLTYLPSIIHEETEGLSAFVQILSLLSEIDELRFQGLRVESDSLYLWTPLAANSLPTINSLIFECECEWMLALARDVLQIVSLRVLGMLLWRTADGESEFKAMLTQYGQNLRGLCLVLSDRKDIVLRETWRSMLLDTLTSLESVTFIVAPKARMNPNSTELPSIANCVNVLPPAKIAKINLIYAVPRSKTNTHHESWESYALPTSLTDEGPAPDPSSYFDDACCALPSLRKVFCGWTVGRVYSLKHPIIIESDVMLWRSWTPKIGPDVEKGLQRLNDRGLLCLQ